MDNPFSEIKLFSHHSDIVRFLVLIDELRCCSAGDDGLVSIWDFKDGKLLYSLQGHSRPITAVLPMCLPKIEGSCDSRWLLLSASSDKLILIWDVESGELLKIFTEHGSTAKCLAALPSLDGYFCSGGERLCLWNAATRSLIDMIPTRTVEDIHLMVAMPNNSIVTSADRQIALYRCESAENVSSMILRCSQRIDAHREAIRCLVTVNDESFASGSLDGAILQWSIHRLEILRQFNFTKEYDSHIYPRSVQQMICLENKYLLCAIGSGFCIFDCSTGDTLLEKNGVHDGKVLCIRPVFYDSLLASCSEDGTVKLWGNMGVLSGDGSPTADRRQSGFLGNFGQRENAKLNVCEIGVCAAHSGAVQCCMSLPLGRFISAGVDAVIILWMDGLAESCKLDRLIRDALFNINI